MNRNFSCRAIVLRARPSGESNREVTFLASGEGIVRATVFGGPKSRLRAHAAPWHEGTAWFYRDPAKNYVKLSDFDVAAWRQGLRESYSRSMAASAIAETVIVSHGGGGGWDGALGLLSSVFDALDAAEESFARIIPVYFLWHWAELLGVRPEIDCCASCGEEKTGPEAMYWSVRDEQLLCPFCAGIFQDGERARNLSGEFIPLHAGTRRWLRALSTIAPGELHRYGLEKSLETEAKTFVSALVGGSLDRRPASWDW